MRQKPLARNVDHLSCSIICILLEIVTDPAFFVKIHHFTSPASPLQSNPLKMFPGIQYFGPGYFPCVFGGRYIC